MFDPFELRRWALDRALDLLRPSSDVDQVISAAQKLEQYVAKMAQHSPNATVTSGTAEMDWGKTGS